MMTNTEIAALLSAMAVYYEMEDVAFKPRAYERAAGVIESLDESVAAIHARDGKKGLMKIQSIGPGIAHHIEQILKKGTFDELERARKLVPVDVMELRKVEGLGPKTIKLLWQNLKIKNLKDLEAAARAGKLKDLPHFKEKSALKILKGIEFQKKSAGRFPLGVVRPLVQTIEEYLKNIPGIGRVTVAGSYRRWQETVGDIDILATAGDGTRVIDAFVKMPEVIHVYGKGPTKALVRLRQGIDADLRVLHEDEYGSGLQYFTGDKQHNVELRKIAIKKGYKLSEYGLFKGTRRVAGRTEEEIYAKLGLDCPPPEIRTASGEIEAAAKHKLPRLIPFGSLKGDLQVQTEWTDGNASIETMAKAAAAAGLSYIAITDHTKSLAMTGGLDERDLARQSKEIDRVSRRVQGLGIRVLKSAEVNILKDGRLDIADATLKTLDLVAVAVHSHFILDERAQTERIIRALKHPLVNILFHPTGRLIGEREPYAVDMLKIIRAAKEYGVALEVNAHPSRLDLKDIHVREAVKLGVKLVIDSDAHAPQHFSLLEYGVATARRGWAGTKDVLNTLPCDKFLVAIKSLKM